MVPGTGLDEERSDEGPEQSEDNPQIVSSAVFCRRKKQKSAKRKDRCGKIKFSKQMSAFCKALFTAT